MPLTIDGQANSITSSTAGVNIPATVGTLSVGPSGSYMNVTSSGVGIGTLTPQEKVHISNSSSSNYIRLDNPSGTAYYGLNSSGDTEIIAATNNNLIFKTFGTERVRIDSAGRMTRPYQPSANWQISCNTSTFVRTLSLKRDANNNLSSVAAGNGSSHGSVGRFTAPIAGVYLITIRGTGTTISGSNELLVAYGSWSTGVNVLNPSNEVLDLRCSPLINDGIGWSCTLYLSANDYWELDWYRPTPTAYVGSTFWDISTVLLG
jgi:hypothetical protein